MKCYHNCEVCVLRNGKGSREGIAIPERPARYVEPKEAEEFREEAPALMPPFYMDTQLEEAPMREKIGAPGSGDGKPRRRHRGGRRRGGAKSGEGVEQPKAEARGRRRRKGGPVPPNRRAGLRSPSRQKPDLGRTGRRPRTVKARPSAAAGPTTGGGAAGTKTAARAAVPPPRVSESGWTAAPFSGGGLLKCRESRQMERIGLFREIGWRRFYGKI